MTRARRTRVTDYRSDDEHTFPDGGIPALLDSLPADAARALLHLFDCQACQDAALAHAFDAVESRDEEKPPIRREVEALMAELLAVPQDRRIEAVKDPRFQRMELLDRVLDETAAACDVNLNLAAHLAALAVWLGTKTDSDDPGLRPRQVRAFCLTANVHRLTGSLDAADKDLDNAACFLSGAPEEVGLYSRTLALLRWEQGRLHDAAALLRHGAQAYGELKRRRDQGVCLALLGLVYVEAGEMKRAPAPLLRGLTSQGDRPPSRLSACGWLSMALAFARLGWEENAREAREQAWLFNVAPEAAAEAEVVWLDGRVAAALGEAEEAGRLLDTARVQLLAGRRIADAALVSLDLAALYAETGRDKEIRRLAAELEEAGGERRETGLGAEALRSYLKSKPSRGKAYEKAAVLSAFLRRSLRWSHPGLQTLPWT